MRAVVIIGGARKYEIQIDRRGITYAENQTITHVPSLKVPFLNDFSGLPEKQEYENCELYLVDPLPNGVYMYDEEKEKLQTYKGTVSNKFLETIAHVRLKDYEEIFFVDYTGIKTAFDFIFFSKGVFSDREKYYLASAPVDIEGVLNGSVKPARCTNFFLKKSLQDKEHLTVLRKIFDGYLKAGFAEMTINKYPLTWELNLGIPVMQVFIRQFNLYPTVPDIKEIYQIDFMRNSQYRYIVTETLAKCLSNNYRDITREDWKTI